VTCVTTLTYGDQLPVVQRRPSLGRPHQLVGVDLVADRDDALGGDLQAHHPDDPAVHDRHRGGLAVRRPGVHLGPAARVVPLDLGGPEQAPQELRDRHGAGERRGTGRDLPAPVADADGVVGEQPDQGGGLTAGRGGEELLDELPGGGLVDLPAGLAGPVVRDVLLRPVVDLLARGLGEVEDLGDLAVRVVEGLAQHVHRALVGRQPLQEGEYGVRHRLALFGGVGGAEHRVAAEEGLGEPLADVGLAAGAGRGQFVEAQVGEDLGQPGLRHLDASGVRRLPPQIRLLHDVLGLADRAEETVGQRLQAIPGGLETIDVRRGRRHVPDPRRPLWIRPAGQGTRSAMSARPRSRAVRPPYWRPIAAHFAAYCAVQMSLTV
jgi:hypothetical protein